MVEPGSGRSVRPTESSRLPRRTVDNFGPLHMRTRLSLCVLALLLVAWSGAHAQTKKLREASPADIVKLPKFCWAQAGVPGANGPEFSINHCPGANHYCEGLLKVEYAMKPNLKSQQRVKLLQDALKDIKYTEERTGPRQDCEIRGHVSAKRVEVENMLQVFGVQPSR
ncbi:MAG: hypothetical protein HXY24_06725 [Rubrivivax sp.]|nr:hypothetical protein [Rubrivivax sp.]